MNTEKIAMAATIPGVIPSEHCGLEAQSYKNLWTYVIYTCMNNLYFHVISFFIVRKLAYVPCS